MATVCGYQCATVRIDKINRTQKTAGFPVPDQIL